MIPITMIAARIGNTTGRTEPIPSIALVAIVEKAVVIAVITSVIGLTPPSSDNCSYCIYDVPNKQKRKGDKYAPNKTEYPHTQQVGKYVCINYVHVATLLKDLQQ